ncbi:MAG: VWA domain-containing protein [Gammaproteobacteria bacterium]
MRRRPVSPFSLSFLDIMFCGFGAVVLLVLILNHDTVDARNETFDDLRAEALRLEREVLIGRENLVQARNSLEATRADRVRMEGESERVIQTLKELEVEIARMERETLASREHINKLKSDLKTLDADNRRLNAEAREDRDQGDKVREFKGDGDRQYLTGLKLGGERVLILLDRSASMLDETIVNVIRRRNMSPARMKAAPKWQRTLATVDWLVANLPASSRFQVVAFNTQADQLGPQGAGHWLDARSKADVEAVMKAVYGLVPGDGTSLHKAFMAAKAMKPRPDNIILLTDGLPTQGTSKPTATTISAEDRLELFGKATKHLPKAVPVNTILLPMEGDIYAAAAFWKLAVETQGSYITPARDWP